LALSVLSSRRLASKTSVTGSTSVR
jgi:hypothetical protein